jgi:hypothetical protein
VIGDVIHASLDWPPSKSRTAPAARRPGEGGSTAGSVAYCMRRIQRGLDRLGATDVVVTSNFPLARPGASYEAECELGDPGVCVRFALQGAAFAIPCDRYSTVRANLMLIARHIEATLALVGLGLLTPREALAKFERLSVSRPPAWREVLGDLQTEAAVTAAFRRLSRGRHPDTPSGSHDAMAELCRARDDALVELQSLGEGLPSVDDETIVFESEKAFGAMQAAERFLTERGFSCGVAERGAPRGLRLGTYHIRRWRDLSAAERAALDGRMTGDMRNGPVAVRISCAALAHASRLNEAPGPRQPKKQSRG